jgi:hypothetical protein
VHVVAPREQLIGEVRADEAGSSGNQKAHSDSAR